MNRRDLRIAQEIATEGASFSQELHNVNRVFFDTLDSSYFAIASAISLTWSKHAKFEVEFITYAANYIDGRIERNLQIINNYSFRFGVEALDSTLINFRTYYQRIRELMPDFYLCDIHDIGRLQQKLLNTLNSLRNNRTVIGISSWLFTGPFKIILGDQTRFWDQEGINAIVLPTGIEVDRGIRRLVRANYNFINGFDLNWLEQQTNSLLENYATYNLIHTYIVNIGKITNVPAIHINSGLYLYGKEEI